MKKWRGRLAFLFILFVMPIIVGQVPLPNPETPVQPEKLVYAATEPLATGKRVLLFYTHSHEAYKPVVAQKLGKQAVYDGQHNIFSLSQTFEEHLALQGIAADTLQVDFMAELKKQGQTIAAAYKYARPSVQEALAVNYDLVLDIHRDSAKKETTTLAGGYAKIAFVVGAEHANYRWNLAYADSLHQLLNELVPGISRGVIQKAGDGVDGIYNQDLAPNMLLVELGGIDNTEEELVRTIAVLTQAISLMLEKS